MNGFVLFQVSESEGDEPMEVPVEEDGSLYLSTLVGLFPGATGLKYRNPSTNTIRGVKIVENVLVCPDEGWVFDFFCVFPSGMLVFRT